MDMKDLVLKTLSAPALVAALAVSPAQANYICSGATGPATGNPYFNGDLTDPNCSTAEVEAALGITIDTNLIAGSKTDSVDENPITTWSQSEFGLGTLTAVAATGDDTSGTWTLTGNVEPLFFVVKWDQGYDVYTYMGDPTSPYSDEWFGSDRGASTPGLCSTINCNAAVSHVSVYGVVPVPAAVWLFGSGLLGLVGIARRRSR